MAVHVLHSLYTLNMWDVSRSKKGSDVCLICYWRLRGELSMMRRWRPIWSQSYKRNLVLNNLAITSFYDITLYYKGLILIKVMHRPDKLSLLKVWISLIGLPLGVHFICQLAHWRKIAVLFHPYSVKISLHNSVSKQCPLKKLWFSLYFKTFIL